MLTEHYLRKGQERIYQSMSDYEQKDWDLFGDTTREFAKEAVPIILDRMYPISSVIDVGCGLGDWLRVFETYGIEDYVGVDGSWVPVDKLRIPQDKFVVRDLNEPLRYDNHDKYDLALCLEVAEHLPPEKAESFVQGLTELSNTILFSSAIPYQGGRGHINEQYLSYWIKIFGKFGYKLYDIRPYFWDKETDIRNKCWWYMQNMVIFYNTKEPVIVFPERKSFDSRYFSLINNRILRQWNVKQELTKEKFNDLFAHQEFGPSQHVHELWHLLNFIKAHRGNIVRGLEIGVFRGGTFRFWHELLDKREGLLVGVDSGERGYIEGLREQYKDDKRVHLIIGDSQKTDTIREVKGIIGASKFDFFFIDGDHRYKYVMNDYNNYKELVKTDGLIIFHDIIGPEVGQAWREVLAMKEHKGYATYFGEVHPCGIGAIIKK